MNTVERVKAICKERKIPISKLERECGFANGYIGQLKKGTLPENRAQIIADYLGVSIEYLISGEDRVYYYDPETAKLAQEIYDNKELGLLMSASRKMRPESLRHLASLVESMVRRENGEDVDT